MKKLIFTIITIGLAFTACKTTEANYRRAYETAKAQSEATEFEETIYAKIREEARPGQIIVGNDTLALVSQYVKISANQENAPTQLAKYNVVVAQFKQIFNAKSMRQRLINAGYTDAVIIETREPLYYVVAQGYNNPSDAIKAINQLRGQTSIRLRDPFPWALSPAVYR